MLTSTITLQDVSKLHKKISSNIKKSEFLCQAHILTHINHDIYSTYAIYMKFNQCLDSEKQKYLDDTYNHLLCLQVDLTNVLLVSMTSDFNDLSRKYPIATQKIILEYGEILHFLLKLEDNISPSINASTNIKLEIYKSIENDFDSLVMYYKKLQHYTPRVVKAHKDNMYPIYATIIISILVAFFVGIKAIKN